MAQEAGVNTSIAEGAYSHPNGKTYEVARNEERELGWLAYELREVSVKIENSLTTPAKRSVIYHRHLERRGQDPNPVRVSIEFWNELFALPLPEPEPVSQWKASKGVDPNPLPAYLAKYETRPPSAS